VEELLPRGHGGVGSCLSGGRGCLPPAVISAFFTLGIIVVSIVSLVSRSTELRADCIELDETAQAFIDQAAHGGELHIVANKRLAAGCHVTRPVVNLLTAASCTVTEIDPIYAKGGSKFLAAVSLGAALSG
jgi:hypothetical protein